MYTFILEDVAGQLQLEQLAIDVGQDLLDVLGAVRRDTAIVKRQLLDGIVLSQSFGQDLQAGSSEFVVIQLQLQQLGHAAGV